MGIIDIILAKNQSSEKLAYTEKQTTEIVPETTAQYNPDDGLYLKVSTPFVENGSYVFSINGVTLKDTVAMSNDRLLFNALASGINIGGGVVAFAEIDGNSDNKAFWFDFEGDITDVTVSVYQETEVIHPIDPKYIPGAVLPVVELSTDFSSGSAELSADETAQLASALETSDFALIKFPIELALTNPLLVTKGEEEGVAMFFARIEQPESVGHIIYQFGVIDGVGMAIRGNG